MACVFLLRLCAFLMLKTSERNLIQHESIYVLTEAVLRHAILNSLDYHIFSHKASHKIVEPYIFWQNTKWDNTK